MKLYNLIGRRLPLSNACFKIGKKMRYFFIKRALENVGCNVNIEKGARLCYDVSIGDRSGCGVNCEINGKTVIGDDVLMGPEVIIYTVNHEFRDKNTTIAEQEFREQQPVHIGNDVWIGRRVIILPGVHIGNGAVIGAGAVVAKDIPEYAIAVGNPIRIIGYRE